MSRRGTYLVSAGILFSRITGLIRQRVLAHYLGISEDMDVWSAAFRIPNFLQNLFGEGALSASFIPSYAELLGADRDDDARELAGAVLALLALVVAVLVAAGELATPLFLDLLVSPNWPPEKRALTEHLVRILFPGAGLLVISAWCLGVLNSHRRFFLSYVSPVFWNAAIIAAALGFGRRGEADRFVVIIAWGAVAGSLLQVLVQWPVVRRVGGRIVMRSWHNVAEVGTVLSAFLPNLVSRGANQISAFIDLYIATMIRGNGALAAIANAQVLYTLPVSLFGMAVSAAELPEMARERGDPETVAAALRTRLSGATERLAFYIVPSAVAFLTLGDVIAGAVLQNGAFTRSDTRYVWLVLAGSATGLLASTLGRLYASTFYALHDTTTPLKCGVVRVLLTGVLGLFAALYLPGLLGLDTRWGAAGLTASAGLAGWVEFALLRRGLFRRLGRFKVPADEVVKLWVAALVAAAAANGVRLLLAGLGPLALGVVVIPVDVAIYLALTAWWNISEAGLLMTRVRGYLASAGRER
jgi:putative peptidoglycan lipid II flippase